MKTYKTSTLVMIAVLIYAAVVGISFGCLHKEVFDWGVNRWVEVFDWRTFQFVLYVLNFIAFVMAFVALGRRGK